MNNGNESEKESVNILSNNRGNHNHLIVFAPVFMLGLSFLMFLVFFLVRRADFLAFMPSVFTGAIELLMWLGIVCVVGIAVRFVLGGAVKDVFAPLVQILLNAWKELRKDRVVHANENFMAYTGAIKISHHEDIRQNYNIKQVDGPAPVPQIEGPKIRYARDLYETGKLFEAIRNDKIILGHGVREDGTSTVWGIPRKDYFSTIAGGLPSSGKTTTAFWILVQQILIGARIILIDPHMHYQSEDGNTSLTKELKPFQSSYVFPPIDTSSSSAIMQRIKWMKQTVDERKRPGYVARLSDIVILVIDEFNSVCELEEIRRVLADDLAYIEREGRKFGLHLMLLGHRWSKDDIGKVNIRTVASTVMAHKQNDEGQAAVLVGSKKHVQEVLSLTPGSYMFRSVNAMVDDTGAQEYRLTKVQTPMISAHDASWVLQLKAEVEAWLATSHPTSTPIDFGTYRSRTKSLEQPNEVESDPDLSPELLSLMHNVMEMEAQGTYTQKEVIAQVWGPEYTSGDRFYKAQSELMQIRKAIALQLARLRSNA
jgi:hypothetical protein